MRVRSRIGECFELACLPGTTEEERRRLLNFVVVGGGPTGGPVTASAGFVVYSLGCQCWLPPLIWCC